MRGLFRYLPAAMIGVCLAAQGGTAPGQTRVLSQAECQAFRERLAEHARLSEGVRRMLASRAAPDPAAPQPSPRSPRGTQDRTEAIRARLEQISRERQQLEELRLAALVRLDLGRAMQLQEQMQALDEEKASLEKQLASLQSGKRPPAPPQPVPPPLADVDRIPCADLTAAYDAAIKSRRWELGAREEQAGVVLLMALKSRTREQIARDLASQFAPWPEASAQVGLLDQDGDGHLDGIVDVPARDVFRLYRQRSDGTVGIEVFGVPGPAADPNYGETTRRLDEVIARQAGRQLPDLLASRPAGPVRVVAETGDFSVAYAQFLAGNFADAARMQIAAARSLEFQNYRGETGRSLDILSPISGGVVIRRIVILPRPNNQELWEETVIAVTSASFWRTEVEVTTSHQTRTTTGAPVGAPSTRGPSRYSLEP